MARESSPVNGQRKTLIWSRLDGMTRRLYTAIIRGPVGWLFTSYRTEENALYRGRYGGGNGRFRPPSPARQRMVGILEQGHLFAALRRLAAYLFACPARWYGLFGSLYGLFSALLHAAMPIAERTFAFDIPLLLFFGVILLLSFPIAVTKKSLAQLLGTGKLGRLVFVRFLGLPEDRLFRVDRRYSVLLPYLSFLLAIGAAVATLWIPPYVIPAIILLLGLVGMIFTYPETGVILSTAALPLLWFGDSFLAPLALLIVLTWLGYGIKLLLLHRSIRFGLLDLVVLIFGALVLTSGMTGAVSNGQTVTRGVLLAVLLSDYFLITNLIDTRALVRRCLFGSLLTVGVLTLLSVVRLLPASGLDWLAGSRAGDVLISAYAALRGLLDEETAEIAVSFLILVQPFMCARLLRPRRTLAVFLSIALILLDVLVIFFTASAGMWVCLILSVFVFFLMYSHHALTVGLITLPPLAAVIAWGTYVNTVPSVAVARLNEVGQAMITRDSYRSRLWQGVWRMLGDHPMGIGLGEEAFTAVYPLYAEVGMASATGAENMYLEIATILGWGGLVIFGVLMLLFLQKSLTCARTTGSRVDRSYILGATATIIGALLLGFIRGNITTPCIFFAFCLIPALCSAYENIVFEECDVQSARVREGGGEGERLYRMGL